MSQGLRQRNRFIDGQAGVCQDSVLVMRGNVMINLRSALAASVLLIAASQATAQRGPSPEQQIFALQQQLAASQSAAVRLEQRLGAIERQLQQVINSSETSAHRINMLESALQQMRTAQARVADTEIPAPTSALSADARIEPVASAPQPVDIPSVAGTASAPVSTAATSDNQSDPGEDAYTEGFKLWEARRYDPAIASLRAFVAAFPKHRRVSWANNLTGRALLDKGEPRAAAEVLLANYRSNPKGGRAQDSLYYLGQALMKLGQPDQACKAYAELTGFYGSGVRPELQPQLATARKEANCS